MTDLAFLKPKYKEALFASGSLPEPEPISSYDLANANLDIEHAKYLIFQLASLALKRKPKRSQRLLPEGNQ